MAIKARGSVSPYKIKGRWTGQFRAKLGDEYLGLCTDEDDAWDLVRAARKLTEGREPDLLSIYGAAWLDKREEDGHVRDIDNERSIWRTHIATAPFIDWPLRKIRPMQIQKWLGALLKKPALHAMRKGKKDTEYKSLGRNLSAETSKHARRVLRACFEQARIEGKITVNPVDGVHVPRVVKVIEDDEETWNYLTPAEIERLFEVLPTVRLRAIFAVAIYGGLREGEIWGLRWLDVHLEGPQPCIRVRRNFEGPCKTRGSRREVPLLERARAALAEWKAEAKPKRKNTRGQATPLVFPSDHGGCYSKGYDAGWAERRERPVIRVPGEVRKTMRDKSAAVEVTPGWCAKAGIRDYVRFHDTRHTCASHLVMGTWTGAPLDLYQVKAWLGHSSISTTQKYAKLAPGNLHDAARGPNAGKLSGNPKPDASDGGTANAMT